MAGEILSIDFSTRFPLISRERNQLETCMLSQKIPLFIWHRFVYNLSRKPAYLESEIVEFGRFWAIFGFFSISPDFVAAKGRRGLMIVPGAWEGLCK